MREASGSGGAAGMSKAVALLFASRIVCFALGFLQMLLLAKKFGASHITDAFLVAEGCHLIFLGVVESNLALIFIPVFIEYREKGDHEGAWRVAGALLTFALLFLVGFTALMVALAPQITTILAPGFSADARGLTVMLMRVMSPLSLLMFVSGFLATLYLAFNRYAMPAWSAILGYAGGPLALFLFADQRGIVALPIGIMAGYLLRFLVLLAAFRDRRQLRLTLDFRHPGVKQLRNMAGPRLLAVGLLQMNLLVDKFFASYLGDGFISALTYASKCLTVPVRLVIGPLGGVIMPEISRAAARHDSQRLRHVVLRASALIGFIVIPVMLYIAAFRYDLLGLLFRRGAFNDSSVQLTAFAMLGYGVGMLSYFLNPLLDGLFFALQRAAVPVRVLAVTSVANVVLDYLLMHFMPPGGIALATSIVVTMNTLVYWRLIGREIGGLPTSKVFFALGRTLLAGFAVWLFLWSILFFTPSGLVERAGPWVRSGVGAAAGCLLYLSLQAVLNRPVFGLFLKTVLRVGKRTSA
jgi:putative peptidoglycan lipid II flippase